MKDTEWIIKQVDASMAMEGMPLTSKDKDRIWTIVNKKDTIFKYIFWERLDSLPIPESCFHFVWCQIA